jgi:hypothetical protein
MQTDDAQDFYPADLLVPGRMYMPHAEIFICLLTCPVQPGDFERAQNGFPAT